MWLNLIDRKNDGKSIQKIINIWITKYSKYKKNIWDSSVLSKRVISWLLNLDIILNNGMFEFRKNFLDSIISQSNHLKKNIKFEKNYFYVALFNNKVFGYVRYEKYDLFYKISISLNKNYRKKGLSQKIIELSEKMIARCREDGMTGEKIVELLEKIEPYALYINKIKTMINLTME